jgi:YbbR domain-containing protein
MWPFRHLGLKALSVGLAVLLWLAVAGEETVERVLRIPLELQQFPAALELVGDFPTAVDVRVRGSSGALSRVTPGDIVAVLDLSSAEPGPHLFQLKAEDVRAPNGVEVVQVNPTTIGMTFVNTASRRSAAIDDGEDGHLVARTIRDRPLDLRNLEPTLSAAARPSDVDVVLEGRRESLVRVQPGDVKAYLDLSGLGPGDYALTVQGNVPHDLRIGRIEPSTVQVRIK